MIIGAPAYLSPAKITKVRLPYLASVGRITTSRFIMIPR
jgi:hypothetical protein